MPYAGGATTFTTSDHSSVLATIVLPLVVLHHFDRLGFVSKGDTHTWLPLLVIARTAFIFHSRMFSVVFITTSSGVSSIVSSCRFVCKNNGVLFENQLLQIGIKSEYRQNLGKPWY